MLIFYAGKYVNAVTAEDLVQHACLDYLKHQEVKGDYINAVTTK